jgi:predicted MFS family arabinose efflux permease
MIESMPTARIPLRPAAIRGVLPGSIGSRPCRQARGPIIFGWIAAAHQLSVAMAAFGAGVLRTALGTYLEAFMFAGLLCLGAALMVLFIGRSGQERLAPAPAE